MPLKKNDIIELKIESIAPGGNGVGRHEGQAVFVPASAPGDTIKARILKAKKNYAFGKIESITFPSPSRIEADCPVFPKCGGCAFRHMSYEEELKIKKRHVEEAFEKIGGAKARVENVAGAESIFNYRNKAQYPVEIQNGEFKAGFYAQNSHRVIDCRNCLLQPEEFDQIISVFENWAKTCGISSYDEKLGSGLLRHIYLRKAETTNEIMVCAVINAKELPFSETLVSGLLASGLNIKSIALNFNLKNTNVILGNEMKIIWGADYITDELCGIKIRISALSFYQVNRRQAQRLYEKAAELAGLSGGETVLDLYCGTGTIGLSMAKNAKKIIGVEIIEAAIKNAEENANLNGISNAEFICADAGKAAERLKRDGVKPEVIILDPPRKGCAGELLSIAAEMKPERIIYISCSPPTLARDCAILKEMGYETEECHPVDMFPRTAHVECVVLMTRKG